MVREKGITTFERSVRLKRPCANHYAHWDEKERGNLQDGLVKIVTQKALTKFLKIERG